MTMHWFDWAIVAVVTALVTAIAYGTKKYTKSVADFLAANRCAGKYLLGIADGIAGLGAIGIIAMFQEYYEAGFTGMWWGWMRVPIYLLITLSGWIIYRYRQTRAMTMAQFFEVRYSKRFRIFAGFIAFISGIINFGLFPAVTADFFMAFCGLPQHMVSIGSFDFSLTHTLVMLVLISIALLFTFMGGQITVIVTDFIQGFFVNIMFVVILAFVLTKVNWEHITDVIMTAPEGQSPANPFDAGRFRHFNPMFYAIWAGILIYQYKAWQGSQAYNSSAKSAHEAKMAGILGTFREFGQMLFLLMLPLCAYALLRHPDFSDAALVVNGALDQIENPAVRSQSITPLAIRYLLPVGLAGAFAAVMVVASISVHDTYLHSWGSIFIQDVVMPFRKDPLSPKAHIWYLRFAIVGVAIFIFMWGWLVPQFMPIRFYFLITGQLYIGGAGTVIIGGLYWKRGTTAAAWTSMIVGGGLACTGAVINYRYSTNSELALQDQFLTTASQIFIVKYLYWALSTTWLLLISMIISILSYILVSLTASVTRHGWSFDMDRMLHKGKFRLKGDDTDQEEAAWGWKAFGMGKEFTRGDKIIYILAMVQAIATFGVFLVGTLLNIFWFKETSAAAWMTFWKWYVIIYFVLAIVVTIWLSIGGLLDLKYMFTQLRGVRGDARDDGTVIDHHNLDDEPTST